MKWRFDHRSCNRNLGNCKFKPVALTQRPWVRIPLEPWNFFLGLNLQLPKLRLQLRWSNLHFKLVLVNSGVCCEWTSTVHKHFARQKLLATIRTSFKQWQTRIWRANRLSNTIVYFQRVKNRPIIPRFDVLVGAGRHWGFWKFIVSKREFAATF